MASSLRLKTCGKSAWLTGRSPSGLVARWPSSCAVCVCAGSSFGTLARRPEPCWVIDKRLGSVMMELSGLLCGFLLAAALPTHSETHQNATSRLIRPKFLSATNRLSCSFHSIRPSRQEKRCWEHMAPEFTKMHFGKVCECGRKRPNFWLSREKIRDTQSTVAVSNLTLNRLIGWDYSLKLQISILLRNRNSFYYQSGSKASVI